MERRALDKAQERMTRLVSGGRDRADALRRKRDRGRLVAELGSLCYEHHKGTGDREADIDRVIAEIDRIDEASTAADAGSPDSNGESGDGQPS